MARAITPVPGGVGPMTIAMLLKNTLEGGRDAVRAQSHGIDAIDQESEDGMDLSNERRRADRRDRRASSCCSRCCSSTGTAYGSSRDSVRDVSRRRRLRRLGRPGLLRHDREPGHPRGRRSPRSALALLTATSRTVALPVAASALTAGLGIAAVVMVLGRMLFSLARTSSSTSSSASSSRWSARSLVAYGGWQSMQEEGTSLRDAADRLQGTETRTAAPATRRRVGPREPRRPCSRSARRHLRPRHPAAGELGRRSRDRQVLGTVVAGYARSRYVRRPVRDTEAPFAEGRLDRRGKCQKAQSSGSATRRASDSSSGRRATTCSSTSRRSLGRLQEPRAGTEGDASRSPRVPRGCRHPSVKAGLTQRSSTRLGAGGAASRPEASACSTRPT